MPRETLARADDISVMTKQKTFTEPSCLSFKYSMPEGVFLTAGIYQQSQYFTDVTSSIVLSTPTGNTTQTGKIRENIRKERTLHENAKSTLHFVRY